MRKTLAIVTLTGQSHSGKDFLASLLTKTGAFEMGISTTTRAPRAGEVHGVNYYFVDLDEFNRQRDRGEFIECVGYLNRFYGMTRSEQERIFGAGKNMSLVCETYGANEIREWCSENGVDVLSVYVGTPTNICIARYMEHFQNELKDGKNPIDEYAKRLASMVTIEPFWRHQMNWDYITPASTTLDVATSIVSAIRARLEAGIRQEKHLYTDINELMASKGIPDADAAVSSLMPLAREALSAITTTQEMPDLLSMAEAFIENTGMPDLAETLEVNQEEGLSL